MTSPSCSGSSQTQASSRIFFPSRIGQATCWLLHPVPRVHSVQASSGPLSSDRAESLPLLPSPVCHSYQQPGQVGRNVRMSHLVSDCCLIPQLLHTWLELVQSFQKHCDHAGLVLQAMTATAGRDRGTHPGRRSSGSRPPHLLPPAGNLWTNLGIETRQKSRGRVCSAREGWGHPAG